MKRSQFGLTIFAEIVVTTSTFIQGIRSIAADQGQKQNSTWGRESCNNSFGVYQLLQPLWVEISNQKL